MIRRAMSIAAKTVSLLSYLVEPGPREIKWATEALLIDYGHARSRREHRPVDKEGRPLPWYTYPAIEYLRSIDLRDRSVFEYGAGNSSLFWAELAASVTTVEHEPQWYEVVRASVRPNQSISLRSGREYVDAIRAAGRKYGVVVVDGEARGECAAAAVECLEDDGFIILDNSDWYPKTAAMLRGQDLIEVDFSGFGPVLDNTWTTSLFLRRAARIRPRGDRLPAYSVGAVRILRDE